MIYSFYNTGVSQVTGTTGALSLRALMNAASAGKGDLAAAQKLDFVILNPEGAIRYTLDGQTPTAAVGLMGATGGVYTYYGADIDKIMIINAQKVNIQLGRTTR